MPVNRDFAEALRRRRTLVGAFVKFRDAAAVEILGAVGMDFVVLDAEHAPFTRESLDTAILAARAAGIAAIVRVPAGSAAWIGAVLDMGAAGVMVPHVSDAETAARLARLMRFGEGGRGFSPSPRAGGYGGRSLADHRDAQPAETVLICQIEDRGGLDAAGAIAATPGVDCLFLGPLDLAVSLGAESADAPEIRAACRRVLATADAAGKAGGIFAVSRGAISEARAAGARLLVAGTDQSLLRRAAGDALHALRDAAED